jgi:hypothetical protein
MKKILGLLVFMSVGLVANAQFFQGFGATIGATESTQRWKLNNDDNLKQRYKLSFNASLFAEFFDHDYIRWITEAEYNRKGARQRYFVDDKSPIQANYLSWNNFLKFRQELYDWTPYWYIGPKAEYFFNGNGIPYNSIHVSGATGIGIEWLIHDPWIWFADFQWNPDIMPAYKTTNPAFEGTPLINRIRHNAFELKIGFKYKGKRKRSTCPAYVDPA